MSRKLSYDLSIFGAALLILVLGLVMIYSASALIAAQKSGSENPYHFLTRQCVWLLVGGMLMFLVMHLDLALVRDRRVIYLLLGVLCIALVMVLFEQPINGTHRWFVFQGIQLQPAELAKPILVLFLASYLAKREERINDLATGLLPVLSVLLIVCGLILLQPDFGTAATLIFVAASLIFVAGLSWRRILGFGIIFVPVALLVLVSADYRRDRILTFLNPEGDPLGKGFQALQSLIALGTGGLTGLGIGNGRQKLFFLPEPHTDFIFSIIGEELGFIGTVSLLAVFSFLVWRGFRVAIRSNDRFVYYAALGLTLLIAVQVLINVSVAVCLLPTKGLPLPLVSYGGSSLMATLLSIGLLLNFSQQSA